MFHMAKVTRSFSRLAKTAKGFHSRIYFLSSAKSIVGSFVAENALLEGPNPHDSRILSIQSNFWH